MMPTQLFGVYPAEGTAGDEVSSTYEGRHVTMTAAELLTSAGSGVATKGLPCVFGIVAGNHGVGVCFNTGTLTDLIAVDTEGIWDLSVVASDDAGNSLVTGGDPLFINSTTGVISKIRNNATQIPFGYALGQVAAAATAVIAVKVHWDPRAHWLQDQEMLYFGDARDVSVEWNETDLEILPLTDDTGSILIGNGTLNIETVQIFGMTVNDYLLWDSSLAALTIVNTAVGAAERPERHLYTQATPAMADGQGVREIDLTVSGIATGMTTGNSHWVNFGGAGVAGANYVHVHNDGIWSGGDISGGYVSWAKFQFLPDSNPGWMSIWELNFAGANSEIDAVFNVNDPTLALGYAAGGVSTVIGSIPFFSTAHGALRGWIAIYDAEFA